MKKKINKRLEKINGFLKSGKSLTLKMIHQLRLEVKHLQAFSEIVILQNNFGAGADISGRLGKLFHEAGKFRKFELEIKAIKSVTEHNSFSKPALFLEELEFSRKKSSKKLRKIQKQYPSFKPGDFIKHPGSGLSSDTWQKFLVNASSSILDLFKQDVISDIKYLHQLRKLLKSIIYIIPVCKNGLKPVHVFLKTRKEFMKSVESKIGSMHDTDFFLRLLEKKYDPNNTGESGALRKIKREWQHDIVTMRKDLKPLLPVVRRFALELKEKANGELNPVTVASPF